MAPGLLLVHAVHRVGRAVLQSGQQSAEAACVERERQVVEERLRFVEM